MRLLQWNIQWCRGMDGVVDPSRIARVARELGDPDVCCFQEVAVNVPALAGSKGEDQAMLLAHAFAGYWVQLVSGVDVPDKRHPSLAGTYLAACTVFAALTKKSPVGSTHTAGLDPELAKFLQSVAWETVETYYKR